MFKNSFGKGILRANDVPQLIQISNILIGEEIVISITSIDILFNPMEIQSKELQQFTLENEERKSQPKNRKKNQLEFLTL